VLVLYHSSLVLVSKLFFCLSLTHIWTQSCLGPRLREISIGFYLNTGLDHNSGDIIKLPVHYLMYLLWSSIWLDVKLPGSNASNNFNTFLIWFLLLSKNEGLCQKVSLIWVQMPTKFKIWFQKSTCMRSFFYKIF